MKSLLLRLIAATTVSPAQLLKQPNLGTIAPGKLADLIVVVGLGDETFLTFLKSYQKSFKGKYGNTAMVMGLLQFLTKKDYAPFFEQYYYGTAMPDVKK